LTSGQHYATDRDVGALRSMLNEIIDGWPEGKDGIYREITAEGTRGTVQTYQ